MIRVGLTGGIGCGKSAVAAELRRRGLVVVDTDQLARDVVEPGEPAFEAILARFGAAVLDEEGRIDRPKLGAVVFGDEAARRELEAITHPRIIARAQRLMVEAAGRGAAIFVLEVPLLYEAGLEGLFEQVVVVAAEPAVQLARVQARDGLGEAEARARLDAQMPVDEKARRADWVLRNDSTLESLQDQVGALAEGLRGLSDSTRSE